MNNENTQKVLDAVARAQREVDSAEARFEREGSRIQRMASYTTIDIYNMSKAVEIVADVKRTTDDLYTSYESIIRTLDMQCRPLLDLGVSADAIKKVADLMKKINEESSSLSSNATGSFNGYSMGDLRTEYYMASLEAKTIEKFWIAKYESTPECAEERKRREAAAAERRKRQAEQAKIEAERKKKEAEEKKRQAELKAAEEKRIEEANAAAKIHMDKCVQDCQKKVADYKKDLKKYIETQRKKFEKEVSDKVAELKKEIKKQEEILSQLGVFKFSEKKQAKQEIKKLEARILKYQDPAIITSEISSMETVLDTAVEKYQKTIDDYLSKRFADYKSTKKKNNKKDLLYVENSEYAKKAFPTPVEPQKVFN